MHVVIQPGHYYVPEGISKEITVPATWVEGAAGKEGYIGLKGEDLNKATGNCGFREGIYYDLYEHEFLHTETMIRLVN